MMNFFAFLRWFNDSLKQWLEAIKPFVGQKIVMSGWLVKVRSSLKKLQVDTECRLQVISSSLEKEDSSS